ncbi:MAG: TonB-dependent receptor, partial [Ignavibacteriales bacterium]|nr:TonB-dependent receptor [Ignavibacteriales bacterium]
TTEVTGVLVALPGIDADGGTMRIRGGTFDQVSFMVDGARARNPLDQTPYMNINLSSIQEMEVITGSFNAEYGEAQSGVINIITKDGGDRYRLFIDQRYTPPGKRHWGPALYDYSTDFYWENTHTRHLQWWIDNPDQWVDPNGVYGNNPASIWTPEQAYQHYMETHKPLTDYTNTPGFQTEASISGPVPMIEDAAFFLSAKYRSQAPVFGNSFRKRGIFFNGTGKLTYNFTPSIRLQFSAFYGSEETSWGIFEEPDQFYFTTFGYTARYAYFDFAGLPDSRTDGQTLRFSNVLSPSTMYELRLSRVHAFRRLGTLPGDPVGWLASGVTERDNVRAVDDQGRPIPYASGNPVGYNTLGYYFRNDDNNTDWSLNGYYSTQINKNWQLKAGLEFTYYHLDHFNESKIPAIDSRTYNPYQGAAYFQNKLEFGGFIMNVGVRYDYYNPNDTLYVNQFDPFSDPKNSTAIFSQVSPRLGIAHPIDERTVLHFSYGHFFQRGPFGDYGEGFSDDNAQGSLTTFVDHNTGQPVILGNRAMRPQKTVAFEVGIERNFADIAVLDITGYYKDITNTIRVVQVSDPNTGIAYKTNGNGNYADVRGLEISLRKLPSHYFSGYVNFTTQLGVVGRSGDPIVVYPDRNVFGPSGDFILHENPRLKAGLFFQIPQNSGLFGGVLDDLLISLEYRANFPNDKIRQDVFRYSDSTYTANESRPVRQNTNMKLSKGFSLFDNTVRLTAFVEVSNLLNDKWINFAAVESASLPDQKKFIQSKFRDLPQIDSNGIPLMETAKFLNLPRSFLFGVTLEL